MRALKIALVLALAWGAATGAGKEETPVLEIGSRLELFVDDFLIERMAGGARLELHRPERREVVLRLDAPWEGNASAFQSVFQEGGRYRMYYRGLHYAKIGGPSTQPLPEHPWVLCYAESDDGIHWRKPELGLCEFNGSKANNILLTPESVAAIGGDPAHTSVFRDANPDCPPDARYKCTIVSWREKSKGLYVLKSADGIHFTPMSDKPSVTEGAFDSQNLIFWDPVRGEYREYHRGFKEGVRDIMTAASKDILHFPAPQWLQYPGSPKQQLYTNQIQPYYRAPHILMGFPMRYTEREWSDPVMALPQLDERLARARHSKRYGTAVTDALFMSSRDGLTFKRWSEAFIRPGPATKETWVYGDNFVFWGMAETRSHLGEAPNDLSFYATEGYWVGTGTSVRRYTLRMDGFVSVNAPFSGGEIVTRPFTFTGGNLALNYETSGAGSVQVEILDADGKPLEGYALSDCPEIVGDSVEQVVRWKGKGGDVRALDGKPVRLRFALKDADLYAFRFLPYQPDRERPALK